MRHLKKRIKLSRFSSHRNAVVVNLSQSLIKHGRVRTTKAKARIVQSFIEKLVTRAKSNSLHAKRIVASKLRSWECIPKLFDRIGPKFNTRAGGYTRIIKIGFRSSDGAEMVLLEFVENFAETREKGVKKEEAKDKVKDKEDAKAKDKKGAKDEKNKKKD